MSKIANTEKATACGGRLSPLSGPLSVRSCELWTPPLTERRCHPTPRTSFLSKAAVPIGPSDIPFSLSRPTERIHTVIGFSVAHRYFGAAIVVNGEPIRLYAGRSLRDVDRRRGPSRLRSQVVRVLENYPATVIGLDAFSTDGAATPAETEVAQAIAAYADDRGLMVLPVRRPAVAAALGLDAATNAAICRAIVLASPFVATRTRAATSEARGRTRLRLDRYWERAVTAAGVARAVYLHHVAGAGSAGPNS